MKRHTMSVLQLMMTVILSIFLSNCDKEKITRTYTWYTPNLKSLTEVRANMKSSPSQALKNPGKIYIYGNYIFLNESDEGRSEERRVGKECRSRWSPYHEIKKNK